MTSRAGFAFAEPAAGDREEKPRGTADYANCADFYEGNCERRRTNVEVRSSHFVRPREFDVRTSTIWNLWNLRNKDAGSSFSRRSFCTCSQCNMLSLRAKRSNLVEVNLELSSRLPRRRTPRNDSCLDVSLPIFGCGHSGRAKESAVEVGFSLSSVPPGHTERDNRPSRLGVRLSQVLHSGCRVALTV